MLKRLMDLRIIALIAVTGILLLGLAGCGGGSSAPPIVTPTKAIVTWPNPAQITYGTALSATQLDAMANVAGTFVYSPAAGTLLDAGSQTLSVTFTPSDTTNYTAATATVTLTVAQATPAIAWPAPAAITYGTALSAVQFDATSATAGAFAYTPAVGTVLNAGMQTLSAIFTPTDTKNYTTATASVMLTVSQARPAITWPAPAAIVYGTPLSASQLDATASVAGTFAYSPTLGAVLDAGSQNLSVTFTPADSNYATTTASVTLKVSQITPVVTWAAPAAISYGTPLNAAQLNATASVPGSFTYSPPLGSVLDAGSQNLSVTFTPTDARNYVTVSASVTIVVTQVTPVIRWATPSPVGIGTVLTATQLDAVASAPGGTAPLSGTYLYSPGSGTVLTSTGTETLHVTFTPTDAVDYTAAQASVTLSVVTTGIVAWGDSLTQGMQGITDAGNYPSELAKLITLPVVNEGINGQTSTQIGVRQGAIATYATVSGGVIPASGGVTVTFPAGYEPYATSLGIPGTILGVHGIVNALPSSYVFNRTDAGDAVSAPAPAQFVVDTPYANYIPIFWEGRNNFRLSTVPKILPDIAAQVATAPPGQDYLVLSITNNNVAEDWSGGSEYNQIIATNQQLQNTYGSHYLDVRQLLVSKYDPTLITDVSDHDHDETPTSLRAPSAIATLASAIGPSDTTFQLNVSSGTLQYLFILTIDTGANAENVSIASISGNTVTVIRNFGGNNTSHPAGAPVVETDKTHLSAKGYQVVADAIASHFSQYSK